MTSSLLAPALALRTTTSNTFRFAAAVPGPPEVTYPLLDVPFLSRADHFVKGPVERTGQPTRGLNEPSVGLDVDRQRRAVPPQRAEHEPVAPVGP
ncbi:hypothetical protein CH063_15155 [Colletotrichum higginsianum]|uniref:Uncharacterized protein n=1 Tax=Colletotrichum higginsianum (strain IMI 349063) TaxID=759273 RepID=H1W1M2_COLHI|nr:hypothetical protein CH063_15155 [Colletotrichum higginsianum]